MAESKRNSMGGNRSGTSTPKLKGPAATGPSELDYNKVIGARVRITTSAPPMAFEGSIFTACPITNLLALNTSSNGPSGNQPGDYKLIPISRIQNFTLLSAHPATSDTLAPSTSVAFENAHPSIARVDVKSLKAREDAAVKKIREKDATKGKGVSKEAQDIFDSLYKTLPTRWHGEEIIVNDSVRILPPYTPDDCKASKDQQLNLQRVQRVLENERKKLASKTVDVKIPASKVEAKAPASSRGSMIATPLPRKGG